MPEISVIVPVYKVEPYIHKCVDSILAQTFSDYELILVDDGSPDTCGNICDEYAKKDARIRVIHKENGGLSDARNAGMKIACGEYVIFIDSDDYIKPNFVEILYRACVSHKADVAMCGYVTVDEQGNNIKNYYPNEPQNIEVVTGRTLLHYFYKEDGVVNQVVWNKIYKKSLFNKLKFQKGRYYEDGYIIAPLFWNVKKIAIVRNTLYYYVQRKNSIMNSKINTKKIIDSNDSYKYRIEFFKERSYLLYMKAIGDYLNWILRTTKKYPRKKIGKKMFKYLQDNYRFFYSQTKHSESMKYKVRNGLAYVNLNILYKLNVVHTMFRKDK